MFASAPAEQNKPQMMRSHSSQSIQYSHQSNEMPPALISNPSIPSATSSTVGSPYSGPINMAPQEEYNNGLSHGLGVYPTIVSQDSFDFHPGYESDLAIGHDKMAANFVGECADLSSCQKRSSTFSVTNCQPPPTGSPFMHSLSASPDHLALDIADGNSPNVPALVSRTASFVPQSEPIFKSPTTPASAYPRTPGTNSPLERRLPVSAAAPVSHPAVVIHHPQPMQQYAGPFQNHFFAQSSGSFMPPLESSCSFFQLLFAFPWFS